MMLNHVNRQSRESRSDQDSFQFLISLCFWHLDPPLAKKGI